MSLDARRTAADSDPLIADVRGDAGPGIAGDGADSRITDADAGTVVAAVVRRGEAVLLARRPRDKRHGSMWEFPGGKVDPGESVADAIARELREELDVTVTRIGETLFVAADATSGFQIRFVAVEIEGTPRPLEHEELRWVDGDRAAELPLAPADLRFATRCLAPGRETKVGRRSAR